MAPQFGKEKAIEFFKLIPTNSDNLTPQDRASTDPILYTPMYQLLVSTTLDPAVEENPEAEGERIGKLLWEQTISIGKEKVEGERLLAERMVRDLWGRMRRGTMRNGTEAERRFIKAVLENYRG